MENFIFEMIPTLWGRPVSGGFAAPFRTGEASKWSGLLAEKGNIHVIHMKVWVFFFVDDFCVSFGIRGQEVLWYIDNAPRTSEVIVIWLWINTYKYPRVN